MPGPKLVYQHFCPAARTLEVIGEKWSLLIVRDLLGGPRRFSDLRRSLASITAKWLSLRLRELEEAGVVTREAAGQREVWYRLTPKGEALAPVVQELIVWGVEHALRPPRPGEQIHPGRATDAFVTYLNRRGVQPQRPLTWVVELGDERSYAIRFDGRRWSRERGKPAGEVQVQTTPAEWVAFLTSEPEARRRWVAGAQVEGEPDRVAEFAALLGRPEQSLAAAR